MANLHYIIPVGLGYRLTIYVPFFFFLLLLRFAFLLFFFPPSLCAGLDKGYDSCMYGMYRYIGVTGGVLLYLQKHSKKAFKDTQRGPD